MSIPPTVLGPSVYTARERLWKLIWLALVLRLVLAVVLHIWVPEATFAPDQITYHSRASYIADRWTHDLAPLRTGALSAGPVGYFYIVASLYYFLGAYSLIPKLLNALVGTLAVPAVYDLTVRMGGSAAAGLKAAAYTSWFPSLVLWSVLNIRDAWIVLLILLICRGALVLQARPNLLSLLLLGSAILALVQFRAYVLFAVVGPVVASFLVQRSRNVARNLIIGALAAAAMIYADQVAGGANRRARLIDLEELNEIRYSNTFGAASRFEQVDISTPGKALVYLPKGLALFLLAPFPWQLGSIRQILALPETLFFYWLIPWMFRGIRHLVRHHLRTSLMALLITAGLTLGYSLGEGNAGTAYRHRAQLICFFLIFAAVGQEDARRRIAEDVDATSALAETA